VERAAKHTTDKRVHDCIAVIHDWIAGRPADLEAAAAAAAWVEAASARRMAAAEKETQRQDLIAAFPPLILKD
jgi:NAD(P)H-hydrate repair Nnr-like enzyme with NAD(P)H-hydrate dehydratase domain